MISTQNLVCSNSNVTNYKQWAKAISDFFISAGWVRSSDTGQVDWAAIAVPPAASAFFYEIFKPGDGLTPFFLKVEYGCTSGSAPTIRLSIGITTNGAGVLTGFVCGPLSTAVSNYTPPGSGVTQYVCRFSGTNNRITVAMWCQNGASAEQFFNIERSVDSTGNYTGTHATICCLGYNSVQGTSSCGQHSYVFAKGVPPPASLPWGVSVNTGGTSGGGVSYSSANNPRGFGLRTLQLASNASGAFDSGLSFELYSPYVGFWDYQPIGFGITQAIDMVEQVTFQVTVYGVLRTYMPFRTGHFVNCDGFGYGALCILWE